MQRECLYITTSADIVIHEHMHNVRQSFLWSFREQRWQKQEQRKNVINHEEILSFYLLNRKTRRKENIVRICEQRTPCSDMQWLWKYQAAFLADRFLSRAKARDWSWAPQRVTSPAPSIVCSTLSRYKSFVHVFLFLVDEKQGAVHTKYLSNHSRWNTSLQSHFFFLEQNKMGKRNMSSTWLCSHQWYSRTAACEWFAAHFHLRFCHRIFRYEMIRLSQPHTHTPNDFGKAFRHLSLLRSCCVCVVHCHRHICRWRISQEKPQNHKK